MTEYKNENNGFIQPNPAKRDDQDCDSYGKIFIGTVEHNIRSWIAEGGRQLDMEFSQPGSSEKGFGRMRINESTSENAPKWKGTLDTKSGDQIEIAGWVKLRKGRPPLLRFTLKPIEETGNSTHEEPEQSEFPL